MTDSIRLGIQKQLSAFLMTEVTLVNGYTYDLTGAVFRGRFWYGEEDPLPLVSILETLTPDRNPLTAGYDQEVQKDKWILMLQGFVKEDQDNPTDPAHQLMAEVKQALAKLRKLVNNNDLVGTAFAYVSCLEIEPGTVRPPDNISATAYFWLRVVLDVIEEVDSPFL